MKKSFLIAAAFAAVTLGASMMPANALPLAAPAAVQNAADQGVVTHVQWRRHHRWHRHYGWRRHYGHRRHWR